MMHHENYDPCFPDQPVVDLYLQLWAKLPSFGSKSAFIWEDGSDALGVNQSSTLTYEQLNSSVLSISSNLLLALERRDTVVVLCAPGLDLVETLFGCQRAGLVGVPIIPPDPSFSQNDHHHLIRVLSQAKPRAAIADSYYIQLVRRYLSSSPPKNVQLHDLLKKLTWISSGDLKEKKVSIQTQDNSSFTTYRGCKAEDVYLIQYTSGATGIPKPVLVTAGSAAHNCRAARKAYDLHPNSVIVSWLPQYHDCGLMFLLLTIVSGATCVLTSPRAFVNRPRLWLELIAQHRATCTPVPSFTLPLVVKRGEVEDTSLPVINMSTMKNLIIINEPIYNDSVEEFIQVFRPLGLNPSAISPSYGLAENCTFVSTAWRSGENSSIPVYKKLLPSARLAPRGNNDNEEIDILVVNKDTHEPVEDGSEGEIWISSPSNASGYLGHPSLTREVFNGRLHNRVSRCFVRTGDTGVVIGEERFLFVTGRYADIIELPNGEILHPHYIETAAYNSCPQFLRGGCVAAFLMEPESLAIVAEMQKGKVEAWILQKICEQIRASVMKEANVRAELVLLVKTGNVPKTTSGKIQRWATKDKLMRNEMNVLMQMKFVHLPNSSSHHGQSEINNLGKEKTERNGEQGNMGTHPTGETALSLSFASATAVSFRSSL